MGTSLLGELHLFDGWRLGEVFGVDGESSCCSPDGDDGWEEFASISARPRIYKYMEHFSDQLYINFIYTNNTRHIICYLTAFFINNSKTSLGNWINYRNNSIKITIGAHGARSRLL